MAVCQPVIRPQRAAQSRARSWAMTMAMASALVGCAPGAAGLVSGDVLEADGARVIVVRGYGFQLRGEPSDAGLTLGYARRTYVYPENTPGFPEEESYWFWVPQPETPPVVWAGETIGLDLRAGTSSWGITLGFRGTSVFAQVPAGETVRRRLRFAPDDPGSTQMRYCRGEDECASLDLTFDGEK
jgi:hypothetical protein